MIQQAVSKKLNLEFKSLEKNKFKIDKNIKVIIIPSAEEVSVTGENGERVNRALTLYKKLNFKPKIIFLGTKKHNNNVFDFVRTKNIPIEFPSNRKEASTRTQIKDLVKFIKDANGLLVVTHFYHIPRIKRYLKKYYGESFKNVNFSPIGKISQQKKQIETEIEKIIKYSAKGDLPLFL